MKSCQHCSSLNFHRSGRFFNRDRRTYYQRYFCNACRRTFSNRSQSLSKNQKKSRYNFLIAKLYSEGMSLRAIARSLNLSYSTVFRKYKWLGEVNSNPSFPSDFQTLYFDEMESIEHTKLKPLTIAIAVDEHYRIQGLKVGRIPAKGHLAEIARAKYGFRVNESKKVCSELLESIAKRNIPLEVRTDQKILYKNLICECFGKARHLSFQRKMEEKRYLQKKAYDPLFAINQRCAKLRSDIKRLTRRSWCTTKIKENLQLQFNIYLALQNNCLMDR